MAIRKRLEPKDYITIGISLLALMISAGNMYHNIHVVDEVLARVVDVSFEEGPGGTSNYSKNGFAVVAVAFTNTGNRPAVIGAARYDLGVLQPGEDEPQGLDGRASTPDGMIPFVLPAKEIRVVPLSIPISCMVARFDRGESPPQERGEEPKRLFEVGFTYRAVDSKGQPHSAWSHRQVYIAVTARGWDGFGPSPSATSPSGNWLETKLFAPGTIERARRSITYYEPPEPDCDELLTDIAATPQPRPPASAPLGKE